LAVEAASAGQVPAGDGPPSDASPAVGSDPLAAAIEAERKRLARALNDGPSQTLSNIVLRAEMVERLLDSDPARARDEARRLREAAVASLADVRRFMFETYPSVLEDLGLISTLRRYLVSRAGPDGRAVQLHVEGEERKLPLPAALAAFRAAQAAVAHLERQSGGASRAALTAAFSADTVEVHVEGGQPTRIPAP
jgi:two-component system, NarL family, sensor histidine kinase DegS